MENEKNDSAERPRTEWGSLTGWEAIVFQLEDEPESSDFCTAAVAP